MTICRDSHSLLWSDRESQPSRKGTTPMITA
jgi:hypothetical protein